MVIVDPPNSEKINCVSVLDHVGMFCFIGAPQLVLATHACRLGKKKLSEPANTVHKSKTFREVKLRSKTACGNPLPTKADVKNILQMENAETADLYQVEELNGGILARHPSNLGSR